MSTFELIESTLFQWLHLFERRENVIGTPFPVFLASYHCSRRPEAQSHSHKSHISTALVIRANRCVSDWTEWASGQPESHPDEHSWRLNTKRKYKRFGGTSRRSSELLRNVGIYVQVHVALQLWTSSSSSPPWEPRISYKEHNTAILWNAT